MSKTDSTVPSGLPDHDPVASGSGAHYRSIVPAPIPLPASADVGEAVRGRDAEADEPPSRGERQVGAIHQLVDQERERYGAAVLVAVRDSLRRNGRAYVLGVLEDLERFPVACTLDALRRDGP